MESRLVSCLKLRHFWSRCTAFEWIAERWPTGKACQELANKKAQQIHAFLKDTRGLRSKGTMVKGFLSVVPAGDILVQVSSLGHSDLSRDS